VVCCRSVYFLFVPVFYSCKGNIAFNITFMFPEGSI
jgi:hypothetical protein